MKKITLLIPLLVSLSSFAQLKPKAMISYAIPERYLKGETVLEMPALSVKSGLSYTYKFLTADFDNTFWVRDGRFAGFTPTHARFDIGIEARRGEIKLRLEHTCWHPVSTYNESVGGIYGGGTWVRLSYGY